MPRVIHTTKRGRSRGQSLVEFALVTPFLLILVVMTIDVGRLMSAYTTIGSMARQGAYYGSLHPTDTDGIESAALGESGDIYGIAPTVSPSVENDSYYVPNTTTHYQKVVVLVIYQYHPIFSFPPMPSTMTIKRQVEMRVTGS
jgi:hypothetical protein